MITYNHEKFIAQAIDSVLMQQTNFDYELVIGEDCSTDSTRAIVVEYQQKHPDKIRLLLPEKNLGMHENGRRTLEACSGEYIALLEGDDYWTAPQKLQKQVEFLESHPECVECFHPVRKIYQDASQPSSIYGPWTDKPQYVLEDLFERNFIPSCSAVGRREFFCAPLPTWTHSLPAGDWLLHVRCAQQGPIGFLNETMGVYRVHTGGAWQGLELDRIRLMELTMLHAIDKFLGYQYHAVLAAQLANRYQPLYAIALAKDDWRSRFHALWLFWRIQRLVPSMSLSRRVGRSLQIISPRAHQVVMSAKHYLEVVFGKRK